jgi:hypothetical protein
MVPCGMSPHVPEIVLKRSSWLAKCCPLNFRLRIAQTGSIGDRSGLQGGHIMTLYNASSSLRMG